MSRGTPVTGENQWLAFCCMLLETKLMQALRFTQGEVRLYFPLHQCLSHPLSLCLSLSLFISSLSVCVCVSLCVCLCVCVCVFV